MAPLRQLATFLSLLSVVYAFPLDSERASDEKPADGSVAVNESDLRKRNAAPDNHNWWEQPGYGGQPTTTQHDWQGQPSNDHQYGDKPTQHNWWDQPTSSPHNWQDQPSNDHQYGDKPTSTQHNWWDQPGYGGKPTSTQHNWQGQPSNDHQYGDKPPSTQHNWWDKPTSSPHDWQNQPSNDHQYGDKPTTQHNWWEQPGYGGQATTTQHDWQGQPSNDHQYGNKPTSTQQHNWWDKPTSSPHDWQDKPSNGYQYGDKPSSTQHNWWEQPTTTNSPGHDNWWDAPKDYPKDGDNGCGDCSQYGGNDKPTDGGNWWDAPKNYPSDDAYECDCDGDDKYGGAPHATSSAYGSGASASSYDVQVGPNTQLVYSPEVVHAPPGAKVTFHFHPKNHTVTQSSFEEPCKKTDGGFASGFRFVANEGDTMETFVVDVKDDKPIWVYCGQTGHCGKGMVFAINPPSDQSDKSFAKFKAKAMATAPPASANNSTTKAVTGSLEGDDDVSSQMKTLIRNGYIILGLLGAVIAAFIGLVVATITSKKRSNKKVVPARFAHLVDPELKSLHLHPDNTQDVRYSD